MPDGFKTKVDKDGWRHCMSEPAIAYSSTLRVSACPQRRHSNVCLADAFDVAIMHIPHFGQGGRRGSFLDMHDQMPIAL